MIRPSDFLPRTAAVKDPYIKDVWILDMASLSIMLGAVFYDSLGIDSQLGDIQKIYEMYRGIFFSKDETINH